MKLKQKWLIKNGWLYDGTGAEPKKADILLENGIIIQIGTNLSEDGAKKIDADGCAVTPGFIDVHRHCDAAVLMSQEFGKLELAQGITTVIGGNCGMSLAPSSDYSRKSMYQYYSPCLGRIPEEVKIPDMATYFDKLQECRLRVNVGTMVGMGSIRIAVKGFQKERFTSDELRKAENLVHQSISQGALGLSTGLMYLPECYSSFEEMKTLWKVAAKEKSIISCHIRGEGNSLVSSVEEICKLSKETGLKINISHFKSVGCKNWKKEIYRAARVLENSNLDMSVDFYPYTGGATTLLSLIPPDVLDDNLQEFLKQIAGSMGRKRLKEELYKEHAGWDNMVLDIGWDNIYLGSLQQMQNKKYIGKNIKEAAKTGNYGDEVDFICDLLIRENGEAGVILMSMSAEDVDYVASLPYSMIISDSLYGDLDNPHPRLCGAFAKVIEDFVCKRRILTLQEAVRKMTGFPASRFQIEKRGFLKEGYYGDVNIFNPQSIRSPADFKNSNLRSSGMKAVFVGGELSLYEGKYLGTNGSIIKNHVSYEK